MGLFWRRKSKDQLVTLGLNEPSEKRADDKQPSATAPPAPEAQPREPQAHATTANPGGSPTSAPPLQQGAPLEQVPPTAALPVLEAQPGAKRSAFATSVLGL